jgi:hypothetical protein
MHGTIRLLRRGRMYLRDCQSGFEMQAAASLARPAHPGRLTYKQMRQWLVRKAVGCQTLAQSIAAEPRGIGFTRRLIGTLA